jgi:hypothetical protein
VQLVAFVEDAVKQPPLRIGQTIVDAQKAKVRAVVAAAFGSGGTAAALVADGGVAGAGRVGDCSANAPTESAAMTAATRRRAGLGREHAANLIEHVLHLWHGRRRDPRCWRHVSLRSG